MEVHVYPLRTSLLRVVGWVFKQCIYLKWLCCYEQVSEQLKHINDDEIFTGTVCTLVAVVHSVLCNVHVGAYPPNTQSQPQKHATDHLYPCVLHK